MAYGDAARKKLVDLFGDGRPVYYTNNVRINTMLHASMQTGLCKIGHGQAMQYMTGGWEIVDLFGDGRPVLLDA